MIDVINGLVYIYAAAVFAMLLRIEMKILRGRASERDFRIALYPSTIPFMLSNIFYAVSNRRLSRQVMATSPAAYLLSPIDMGSMLVAMHYLIVKEKELSDGD